METVLSVFGPSLPWPSWYAGRFWLLRLGYYKLMRPKPKANDWVWISGCARAKAATGVVKSAFHASQAERYEPCWVVRRVADNLRTFDALRQRFPLH